MLQYYALKYARLKRLRQMYDACPFRSLNQHIKLCQLSERAVDANQQVLHVGKGKSISTKNAPVDPFFNLLYTTNITIGTPPQSFIAAIDILGPSPIFVPSSRCKAWECEHPAANDTKFGQYHKHSFNSTLSSTYAPNGTRYSIFWGGYDTFGPLSKDVVRIGDVTVHDTVFLEVEDMRIAGFITPWSIGYDGAIGLAPPWSSEEYDGYDNILGTMISQNVLDEPVFSMKLPQSASDQGTLILGGIDEDLFTGPITSFPVLQPRIDFPLYDNAWAIPLTSITFNTPHPLHWEMPKSSSAVLDSGYPCIFLPNQLFRNVTAACGGKKFTVGFDTFYEIPCERRQELPTLTFSIAEHNLTISPFDYTLEVDFPWMSPQIGRICLLSFQNTENFGMPSDLLVLSSPFLRGFYTVFDAGKMEVGCK
jgi:saccharopepsin